MYDLIDAIAASVVHPSCRTRVISPPAATDYEEDVAFVVASLIYYYYFWMSRKGGSKKPQHSSPPDSDGMFQGMVVFLLPKGVQLRRLQVWRQKLTQMGAVVGDNLSKKVTHIFATNYDMFLQQLSPEKLSQFKGCLLCYQWLENCLKLGEKIAEEPYVMTFERGGSAKRSCIISPEPSETRHSDDESLSHKRCTVSFKKPKCGEGTSKKEKDLAEQGDSGKTKYEASGIHGVDGLLVGMGASHSSSFHNDTQSDFDTDDSGTPENKELMTKKIIVKDMSLDDASHPQCPYDPPDLNKNITEIFGKLINIYRALGDERRSFSYYKAIPVIEKLPFRIESVDQVKNLPTIGKSLQDHIHEILSTGKLSKLEHFENDEKVKTVSLFGEVWGIGPVTALKLYEKGHHTLDDLKQDDSLSTAQKIGLKYFDDIKKRIPRHEVKDMEMLLQKAGQELLPGMIIVCGGSYRRGKASCGDLDIVITHPDGESHEGFLLRYVQYLKDIKFLREDLVFSMNSTEGTDSGVDTYFGLCTYPGRELRRRIDLKVYPRDRYAFGLIAWTGNDVLNRRLRLLAESKGYRLDDTGLYLATQDSSGKRGTKSNTRVTCYTEKEVFDVLGFPWLEPHERNL
ncbi:DNA polymerase lambda-like isoform X3 [Zingiber officinale]|uniref:DNA polymerase lambda-like isoform X3 n=1 Tax=Zingiber officinale TaxID=94328 RepID=UPI001C4A882E|nr:DNA polymerase lambda-like isoform X3 [Zingiber officinale]